MKMYESIIGDLEQSFDLSPLDRSNKCCDTILTLSLDSEIGFIEYSDYIERLLTIIENELTMSTEKEEKKHIIIILIHISLYLKLGAGTTALNWLIKARELNIYDKDLMDITNSLSHQISNHDFARLFNVDSARK